MFNKRQSGLTVVELVIFIVIMGVAAAGILQVMNLSVKNSADPARRKQAMLIAEAFMEEVQQAQMALCDVSNPNAATAKTPSDCGTQQQSFGPPPNTARPYYNVKDYVSKLGEAQFAFRVNGVDVDVANAPVGTNGAGVALGNASLAGITTTLTLNAESALGPAGATVPLGTAPVPEALRITITVTYGPGVNDVITLDGYRTRYVTEAR